MLLGTSPVAFAQQPFRVANVYPGHKTKEIELEPLIQIHVSEKFDPATVNEKAIKLIRRSDRKQVAVNIGGDLGGVVTLSVENPLEISTEYELQITPALLSRSGSAIEPLKVRFHTTSRKPGPPRTDIADFQFTKTQIDRRDGVCGLAVGNERLFACTWDGKLVAYSLDENGKPTGEPKLLLDRKRRFNAIVVDPKLAHSHAQNTIGNVTLWLSHDSQHELSLGPNDFSGTISRVDIDGERVSMRDVITGLPTGDHPASGLTFGPDGRLFVSQGALSMLGGKPEVPETPLSAATLAINLRHSSFENNKPLDVRDFEVGTNPEAIQVFATGIREAFDLCWHSSGNLFAGVNMNDTNETTPARDHLPAVTTRPAEMMLRIAEGKYYGHPNPSRNEWVLLGGNPTSQVDPWEVATLPVGTNPESNFDPSLLIRDLEKDKGPSADGVCEWTSSGSLQGRLLFCFYTATRGVHSYKVTADGRNVTDHQPLVGEDNRILRFGAPLDIVHDPRGWLYVADFSAPQRGDSGRSGGVWLVKRSSTIFSDNFDASSRGERIRNTIGDPEPDGLAYKTDTPFGHVLKNWVIADPTADTNKRSFWCIPEAADGGLKDFAQQAGRSKNSIAFANVPIAAGGNAYTIHFRQWCNDNDYIGFIIGASKPTFKHDGVEFGYTRQLPGTDTTVKDAYVEGALGKKKVVGAALRKRWVDHRIEVTSKMIHWFQNDKLVADGVNTDQRPGGYFGIRHKFERGTRYDDVKIVTHPAGL